MSIIIGIDHGYYAIKTAHCSFPAGLTSYGEHEPYTRQGLLEFGGCFFVCGSGRQPIQRDKTVNDNYYLLTLAAIAKEIHQRGLPPECSVRIAAGLAVACRWQPGMKITALLDALNSALAEPFALAWVSNSPRFLLVFTVIYAVAVIVAVTDQKNTRPGAEHGSAAWGDVFRLNKFYMDRHGSNLLLTQHFHIGIDGYKHKHNTNILIVGGSGAGKTRTYGVPNVLECACSMVITDPKAEILRKTGNLLKQKGYEVIVFDLINPAASFCYNPFVYVHDDREVLTLIENLIRNTTPSHSKSSDPFWEKSETALLQALMLYLLHEAPPEEQNFPMVMEMIAAAEVHEDDDNYQSPLDILFERLEMREPDSIACKQYRIFKQAAGDICSK